VSADVEAEHEVWVAELGAHAPDARQLLHGWPCTCGDDGADSPKRNRSVATKHANATRRIRRFPTDVYRNEIPTAAASRADVVSVWFCDNACPAPVVVDDGVRLKHGGTSPVDRADGARSMWSWKNKSPNVVDIVHAAAAAAVHSSDLKLIIIFVDQSNCCPVINVLFFTKVRLKIAVENIPENV